MFPDVDENQLSHDSMEHRLQMELWRGNVAGAVQMARERNEISDWIVAMAPLASYDLWELISSEYAEKLEEEGHYHKAVTYLLAGNNVHQAIDLFRRHRLFKEAVSLTRLRLSPVDPMLEDLYTEWGQALMKDGQFEQAAQCYLAMRQIQDAEKIGSRHRHQLILETPTYTPLSASDNQPGLVHAYTVCSQNLVMGQWQEAYKFIQGHESLKVLLPLLSTHQLLTQQLISLTQGLTLTNRPVTPEMFSVLEKKEIPSDKTEFPEFLVDRSEIDPVVPWDPFLIGEHTFAHHLLRVWHHHLIVTMATSELKRMHTSLSLFVSRRQNNDDLASTLVLVSLHLTLCLLSLLMSETSCAVTHFLHAMSTLHQGNHTLLLQGICRLMLPQGPKYLLKLQQEFTACRVLITMENHGDMNTAGGENHNSIKKFLTDIKDDNAISMSSLRFRELDCLRAYYYLAILDFLSVNLVRAQYENDSHDGMPNRKDIVGDQNISVDCVCEKNSTNVVVGGNKMNKKPAMDIINSHQDLINCKIQKMNMKTTKCDIKDTNFEWNASYFHQKCKTLLSVSCSTLPQSSLQTETSNSDSIPVTSDSHNNGSVKRLTSYDDPNPYKTQKKTFNKHSVNSFAHCCNGPNIYLTSDVDNNLSQALANELKPLSTSSSEIHVPLQMLGKSSVEPSGDDLSVLLPKLTMLKMSPLRRTTDGSNTINTKSSLSSSLSWPSYSPFFLSPSNSPLTMSPLHSPLTMSPLSNSSLTMFPSSVTSSTPFPSSVTSSIPSPSSNSPSHHSRPSFSLSSMSATSNSPSTMSPSLNTSSHHSTPSFSLSLMSSTSNSPLTMYPSSNTPSHHSAPSFSLSSMSPTSNSPSTVSLPSNPPLTSPNINLSSDKPQVNINKSHQCACDKIKITTSTQNFKSKSHLNYTNLLRLSKGILWDVQAKREVLTETLGYIHHAISQNLLNTYSKGNNQYDPDLNDNCKEKQSVTIHNDSSPTVSNELEEDGGFDTTSVISSSGLPGVEVSSGNIIETASARTCESSTNRTFNSSNTKPARLPFPQSIIQNEDVAQQSTVDTFTENYLHQRVPLCQSSRQDHSIGIQNEQEHPVFKKSRKVLWMDGKEASTKMGADDNISACQVSRHAPDGSVIPLDWDDMPVDMKYSQSYVTLSLLKQEQALISQELKRVPDMSEIPFPSIRDSIRSLLHTSLVSPCISVEEKSVYLKQLNDWATLFSVTARQQRETETMFTKPAEEYLKKK